MGDAAFTRRGILKLGGGLSLSGLAQSASPAFTGATGISGAITDSAVPGIANDDWDKWRPVDRLLELQREFARSNHYTAYDHDIAAMKSWAPWAKALKQRQREFDRMSTLDKLKAKMGVRL